LISYLKCLMHGSLLIRGRPVALLNWNFHIDWPLFEIRLFSWLTDWNWKYLSLNHKKNKKQLVLIRKIECLITLFVPALTMICIIYEKKKKNRWRDGRHRWHNPFYYVFIKTLLYIAIFYILWNIKHIS